MANEEKEPTLTKEEQEQLTHEKAVNEDVNAEPLSVVEGKQPEKDESKEEAVGAEKEAPADEFDAELLAIAADLGMDESKARSYSSPADLERALLALSSRDEPEVKKEEEKKQKPEPIHIQAGDDLDEALVKQVNEALDRISGRQDEKSAALERTISDLTNVMQANQAAQFINRFDDMLKVHGASYMHELGEGPTLDLAGKQRVAREKIVDEMGLIVASHQLRKRPIPSDDQLMQRALKEVFGGKDKDNGEVEKRKGQFLRRGSSRSSTPPSKRMRARLELREKLAALGGGGDE